MKKINFKRFELLIFIGIIVAFVAFSCNNSDLQLDGSASEVNTITSKTIEFVGIEHNQMLEETFQFLKKQNNEQSTKYKSSKSKRKGLEDFLISRVNVNNKYSNASNNLGIQFIRNLFSTKQNSSKNSTYSKKTAELLSGNEKKYLGLLNEILNKINLEEGNSIEENIINLEKVIEKDINLTDKQIITLFSATQTAKYSYNYWIKNIKKWKDLRTNNSTITLRQLSLKIQTNTESNNSDGCKPHHKKNCAICKKNAEETSDIVKADVTGAVGAAAATWVVNTAPGGGQVAYGGAIVAGAVGGSTVEAVDQFLGWLGW